MRASILLIILLCITNVALADHKTKAGIEYSKVIDGINSKKHANIFGLCDEASDGSGDIICNLNKTMIFKTDLTDDLKLLHDLNNKQEFKKLLAKHESMCTGDLLKKNPNTITNNKEKKLILDLQDMCAKTHSGGIDYIRKSITKDVQNSLKKNRLTCGIETNDFIQRFKYHPVSHRWVFQSRPEGVCGIINIAYIEQSDEYHWRYTSKMIITNKSNIDPRGPCSSIINNEKDTVYESDMFSDDYEQVQLVNCKYISFAKNYKWG